MIILYAMGILAILWLIGFNIAKFLKMEDVIRNGADDSVYVVWGFIFLLPILMIPGLILPMYVLAPMVLIVLLGATIYHRRAIAETWNSMNAKKLAPFWGMMVPMALYGFPQMLRHELYTVVWQNNDFAYYMSSIEWLRDHRILAKITYSLEYPFDSLAEYMMVKTRIGADVVSAFFSRVFFLDPYQVFPVMIVLSAVLIYLTVNFIVKYFTERADLAIVIAIFATCSGVLIRLTMMQYLPQMMGIPVLMLTFFYLNSFMRDQKKYLLATAFVVSALLAVYAEYAVYVVLYGLIVLVVYLVKRMVSFPEVLKLGGLSLILNPYGTYKAFVINLFVLGEVSESPANIDVLSSNMFGIKKLVGNLMGISHYVIDGNSWLYYYGIKGLGVLLAVTIVLGWFLMDTEARTFLYGYIAVFVILECYFLASRGGYQEYKHITTATAFCICFLGVVVTLTIQRWGQHNIGAMVLYVAYCFLAFNIVIEDYDCVVPYITEQIVVDDRIMELSSVVEKVVPDGEEIEIDDSIYVPYYMAAVYALQDYPVNLNTNSLAYFQYFQEFEDDDPSDYVLYTVDHADDPGVVVWSNEVYKIVERQAN